MKWYIATVAFSPPAKDVQVRIHIKQEVHSGFGIGDSNSVNEVMRMLRKFDGLARKKFDELDVTLEAID